MLAKVILGLVASALAAHAQQPSKPSPPSQTRPRAEVALTNQRIPESLGARPVVGARLTGEQLQERLATLIKALELPVRMEQLSEEAGSSKRDRHRFRAGDHKFEVFPESSGIKYENRELYRVAPKAGEEVPSDQAMTTRAARDLDRLAAARLIELAELDRENPHISHQRARSAERSQEGVKVGTLSTLDTRLDFTRRIEGIRVAGNGVRLIYGNDQRLYACEIVWRPILAAEQKLPLAITREQALSDFREAVDEHTRQGAEVELLQAELVYVDPGPKERVATLDPTYLFLYRVRTPIPDKKDEYIVSKKMLYSVPALKAGISGKSEK